MDNIEFPGRLYRNWDMVIFTNGLNSDLRGIFGGK